MNKYGMQAMAHWKTHAPQRFQLIENPEAFLPKRQRDLVGFIGSRKWPGFVGSDALLVEQA